jgi:hypothetical protein
MAMRTVDTYRQSNIHHEGPQNKPTTIFYRFPLIPSVTDISDSDTDKSRLSVTKDDEEQARNNGSCERALKTFQEN